MTREEAINEIKSWDFLEGKEIEAIQTLIPELKESEDERIRKALIQYLKDYRCNLPNGLYSRYDFFAYLEKQKDKMTAEEYENSELFQLKLKTKYANGYQDGLAQKEQKENIEKEYVFRPLAGTDITIAAEQAIRRVNKGDSLVLAFNGAYIPIRKGCKVSKIVDIYDAFIEKQKEQTEELSIRLNGLMLM